MQPEDARAIALAEDLGAQLGRLKGAGPKLMQFLSMLQLDAASRGRRVRCRRDARTVASGASSG